MSTVNQSLAMGATDFGHAMAIAVHDELEKMVGPKRVDRIWNSDSEASRALKHEALWLAVTTYSKELAAAGLRATVAPAVPTK